MPPDRRAASPNSNDPAAKDTTARGSAGGEKSPDAFRTISEVSEELGLPQHVLRFWETRFTQIKPLKRGGGRRLYRPDHIALLRGIKALLYDDGLTIKGAQKVLRERGQRAVMARGRSDAALGLEAAVPADATERLAAIRARLEAVAAHGHAAAAESVGTASEMVTGDAPASKPAATRRKRAAKTPSREAAEDQPLLFGDLPQKAGEDPGATHQDRDGAADRQAPTAPAPGAAPATDNAPQTAAQTAAAARVTASIARLEDVLRRLAQRGDGAADA